MKVMLAFVAACSFVMSTSAAAVQPKPLFAASDPIHIVIQAPLSGLIHNRSDLVVQGLSPTPMAKCCRLRSACAGSPGAQPTSATSHP